MTTTTTTTTKKIIIVKHNAVIREKGFWYFIDGQGNICKVLQNKGKKKLPEKTIKKLEKQITKLKKR